MYVKSARKKTVRLFLLLIHYQIHSIGGVLLVTGRLVMKINKINPIAKDLRQPKYRQQVVEDKTKYKRKRDKPNAKTFREMLDQEIEKEK